MEEVFSPPEMMMSLGDWRQSSELRNLHWSSSELTQSLSQRPHLACLMPQPPARGDRLGGVEAMLVVAVVRSLRSTRPSRATVHSASPFPCYGRRPAWFSRPRLGHTPNRFAWIFWLLGRVHGVVRHFSPSPPPLLSFPGLNSPCSAFEPAAAQVVTVRRWPSSRCGQRGGGRRQKYAVRAATFPCRTSLLVGT
jgi:hypothetical protein